MPKKTKTEETKVVAKKEKLPEEKVMESPVVSKEEKPAKDLPKAGYYFGVGRRKTATARVRLHIPSHEVIVGDKTLTKGESIVNGKPMEQYFSDAFSKAQFIEVFRTTNTIGRFVTTVTVSGSGSTGQLGAVVLGIARALCQVDPKFQPILRKRGFLTRDPRGKERKKPGLMGARKKKQSPKR